jgi:methionine-rich copper-binding protein CopC
MTRLFASALALAAAVAVAGEASAHARLIRSDPKAGTTVAAPKVLRMQFSESIVAAKSSVTLDGAVGSGALGKLAVDARNPRLVSIPVAGVLTPGAYKVHWTMTTEDTHTMTGDFGFTVK